MSQTFGQAFRKVRQERGATHANLAKHFSVRKGDIRDWEADKTYPNDSTVLKRIFAWAPILRAFELEVKYGSPEHRETIKERNSKPIATSLGDAKVKFSCFGAALQWARLQESISPQQLAGLLGSTDDDILECERGGSLDPRYLPKLFELFPALVDAPAPRVNPPEEKKPMPPPLPKLKETFGQRLRRLREESGFKTAELGNIVGVSPSMVRAWEKDLSLPTRPRYDSLVECFPSLAEIKVNIRDSKSKPGRPIGEFAKGLVKDSHQSSPAPKEPPPAPTLDPANPVVNWAVLLIQAKTDDLAKHRLTFLKALKDSDLKQAAAQARDLATLLENAHQTGLTMDQLLALLS